MSIAKRLSLGVVSMLMFATVASASAFRAADIVYLPAVARLQGGNGAFFKTDVTITNTSSSRVVVSVAYLPTNTDNSTATNTLVTLPTFAPGERRELVDVALSALNREAANGYLIFFACREGGNCSACDTNPGDCLNILVQGRIYNDTANGTFGQSFPGIPWYNYVSVNSSAVGLDKVSINGIRNNTNYRTNIGLVNASQFSSTVLRIRLFNNTGTQIASIDKTLPPLGHTQFSVAAEAPTFAGDGYATVEQVSVTPAPGQSDANPGFMAYGSLLDNRTSDPTTLEAVFNVIEPYDCIFGTKTPKRQVKR